MYPEYGIAPGGSSKQQRKYVIPPKYKVAKGTEKRFGKLGTAILQAEINYEAQRIRRSAV